MSASFGLFDISIFYDLNAFLDLIIQNQAKTLILFQFSSQRYDTTSSLAYSSQTWEYEQGSGTEWLHMQVGGAFERVT